MNLNNMTIKASLILMVFMNSMSFQVDAIEIPADSSKGAQVPPETCYRPDILLDPGSALSDRQEQFRRITLAAGAGQNMAQYVLGSLYRLGEKHPTKLVIKDDVKARAYLSNAAINGSYAAMAGIAELELANKNYREAMLWAQVFTYYSKEEAKKNASGSNLAYPAFLLKRIMDVTRKNSKLYPEKDLFEDFNNFFRNYDANIKFKLSKENIEAEKKLGQLCDPEKMDQDYSNVSLSRNKKVQANSQTTTAIGSPGFAFYLLMIDPKGVVTKAMTVDSLPDDVYAEKLMRIAKDLQFNQISGSIVRSAYVPLSFDDNSVAIKKSRR